MRRTDTLPMASLFTIAALLASASVAVAAPPTTTTTVATCAGPWAMVTFPTTVEGESVRYAYAAARAFESDPEVFVANFLDEYVESGFEIAAPSIWGARLNVDIAQRFRGLAVPAPDSGCAPALAGVAFRPEIDDEVIVALTGEPDLNIPNTNGIVALVPEGTGPVTVTVTGVDTGNRGQAYCEALSGISVIAPPDATVFYDGGDTGTHELVPCSSVFNGRQVPTYIGTWLASLASTAP